MATNGDATNKIEQRPQHFDVYVKTIAVQCIEVSAPDAAEALAMGRKQCDDAGHSSILLVNRATGERLLVGASVPLDQPVDRHALTVAQAFERRSWCAEALVERIATLMNTEDVAEEQQISLEEAYATRDFEGEYDTLMWLIDKARAIQTGFHTVAAGHDHEPLRHAGPGPAKIALQALNPDFSLYLGLRQTRYRAGP